MNKHLLHNFWKIRLLGFITSSLIVTLANSGLAQIVPDSTLGKENSVVNPNANVHGLPASLIEGGATRGVNLFQSFSKFNVGDGQRVYFSNPEGIQNILSRITGSDPSKIFGTLGVNGRANLFFLNPNGIIFGSNARLDVAGSFFASTANSFVFENGLKFSATNPEAPPLITVSIRPGLQFGGNQSGTITSTANLNAGQDLTLAGVKLDLQGKLEAGKDLTLQATDTVKIRDTVVNPFIASAGGKLVLQGDRNVDIFALNNLNSGFFSGGDMLLRSANTIGGDAHYWAGRNFQIEKLDGNLGNLFSPYDPVIRASGDVNFNSYTGASLHILAGGSVTIGTVDITGADPINGLSQEVRLSDGTPLQINGATQPTLDIRAGTTDFGTPEFSFNPIPGLTGIANTNVPATSAKINIGNIKNINTTTQETPIKGLILLTNQYRSNGLTGNIETGNISTFGNVIIDSRGEIKTTGIIDISGGVDPNNKLNLFAIDNITTGELLSDLLPSNIGNGGNISLFSQNGTIDTTAGDIISRTTDGVAGNVELEADGDIRLGNIEASSNNNTIDAVPTIKVVSNQGSVFLDNSRLSTSNSGSKFAGDISITAAENVSIINDSRVSSQGRFGRIYIGASNDDGSPNYTSLSPKQVEINNSRLSTTNVVTSQNGGNTVPALDQEINAGDISIKAEQISLTNNSLLDTQTAREGNAGDVLLEASNGNIFLDNRTTISSKSENGAAGNVELEARGDIRLGNIEASSNNNTIDAVPTIKVVSNQGSVFLDNSRLSTSNSGSKFAGDISITAAENVSIINDSRVSSQGRFGRIYIGASNDDGSPNYTFLSPKQVEINNSRLSTTNVVSSQNGENIIPASDQEINAGNISIKAEQISLTNNSLLDTQTARKGNAGKVNITSNTFEALNGSQVLTNTATDGRAGGIELKVADNITLSGYRRLTDPQSDRTSYYVENNLIPSGLFATTGENSTGLGGSILLDPTKLVTINDRARITVDSNGSRDAGKITLNTNRLTLDNQGKITGDTNSGVGGGIEIKLQDLLLMRRQSLISTQAGQAGAGGNGGNITITRRSESKPFPFIVGIKGENSDIVANAETGQGGRIEIEATRFGIAPLSREQLGDSEPSDLPSNDIIAISEQGSPALDGQVNINSPDINFANDLVSLPENPIDASRLIAQSCGTFAGKRNKFINTGRGGLPPRPDEPISSDAIWNDTRLTAIPTPQKIPNTATVSPTNSASAPIIPATGWVFNSKGDVTLVSQVSGANSSLFSSNSSGCRIR